LAEHHSKVCVDILNRVLNKASLVIDDISLKTGYDISKLQEMLFDFASPFPKGGLRGICLEESLVF